MLVGVSVGFLRGTVVLMGVMLVVGVDVVVLDLDVLMGVLVV